MNEESFINHLQEPNLVHISFDQYNDLSCQLYVTLSIDYLYEFNAAIKCNVGEIMCYSKKHEHHYHHQNNDDIDYNVDDDEIIKNANVLNSCSKNYDYLKHNDSSIHHHIDEINDNCDSDTLHLLLSEMKLLMLYYTRSINKHKFLEEMSSMLNNDVYLIEQLLHAINSLDSSTESLSTITSSSSSTTLSSSSSSSSTTSSSSSSSFSLMVSMVFI